MPDMPAAVPRASLLKRFTVLVVPAVRHSHTTANAAGDLCQRLVGFLFAMQMAMQAAFACPDVAHIRLPVFVLLIGLQLMTACDDVKWHSRYSHKH